MYVDNMHQPWRTLASIINKCLSGKTASNDRLRKSIIDILWGRFYRENVDYSELIWEDFAFQIDPRLLKKGRHENMPYPGFKFVRIGEDYQEYGLPIPETMLTYGIKQAGKRIATRRVVMKKVSIFADDNIIHDPNVTLELVKSISLTEAVEEEAARQVYATHARIVIELVPEPARKRPPGIAFRYTSSVSKKMYSDPTRNLKGVQNLTPKEQIVADMMKALNESKKTSRKQSCIGGSSEKTSLSPGVPNEYIVVPTTLSNRTGTKLEVPDGENVTFEVNVILEWGSEQKKKKDDDDNKSINLEQTDDEETNDEFVRGEEHVQDDDEETDDEFVHGNEQVNDDEDEEMTNAKVKESRNGDEGITDAAKVDAGKTKDVKDDAKKVKLPPTSSSLSVSSGFGDQFLKLSSDTSLISTVKDTTYTKINSLLDIKI
nr:hypothetical protein [Tanacetum cinerariifolium]